MWAFCEHFVSILAAVNFKKPAVLTDQSVVGSCAFKVKQQFKSKLLSVGCIDGAVVYDYVRDKM